MPTADELPIDTSASALDMANAIFGAGVTVNDAEFFGDPVAAGIYSNGDAISPGVVPGDTGVILSTGQAQDFTNSDGSTNTNTSASTGSNTSGVNGDAQFDALAGSSTFDAAILEVDFTPDGNILTLDFVIGSEEYPEFVTSQFLDTVGIWINGVEAQVTIGSGQASIGNINASTTPSIYNDNQLDQFNTEMDGFTVTLSISAPVNPGVVNTLRIGVADVADSGYDTNLLIAGGSVQTAIVAVDDSETFGFNDTKTLDVLTNDASGNGVMTITHINEIAVSVGDTVTLSTGQQVTLNADGTLEVVGDGDAETTYFNYTIDNGAGLTDTGLVELIQVPCFVAGTRIDTVTGPVNVERLEAGDLVLTRDQGPMPILWVGSRKVGCDQGDRPVRIKSGSYGALRDVLVSPNHRILLRDVWAELLYGVPEVLVRAKDLVNHKTVLRDDRPGPWSYFHILLDSHQMLRSDGLFSESYQPGLQGFDAFDELVRDELAALFPNIVTAPERYGASARLSLKSREAAPLLAAMATRRG